MKEKVTRILAFMLMLCMVLTLMPSMTAKAADDLPTYKELCEAVDAVIGNYGGVDEESMPEFVVAWSSLTEGTDHTLDGFLGDRDHNKNVTISSGPDGLIRLTGGENQDYVMDFYFEDGTINSELIKVQFEYVEGHNVEITKQDIPEFNCNIACHADTHYYVLEVNDRVKVVAFSKKENGWTSIMNINKSTFTKAGITPEVGKMYHSVFSKQETDRCLLPTSPCDNTKGEADHAKGTYHEAVAATCEKDGNVEYYECPNCGKYADANGKEIKTIIDPIDENKHSFDAEWTKDETSHWHVASCSHKDAVADKKEHAFVNGKCSVCGYVKDEPAVQPTVQPTNPPAVIVDVKGTDYDTLDVAVINKPNGKFKALTVSGNNGVLTVPAGTKLLMEKSNWSVKGYYDGRVTSATEAIKWNAASGEKADVKALKKYTTVKYNKKTTDTSVVTKNNKKVAGSVYAVKLVDDKGNTIILNIERDEINKAVKKTKLAQSVSGNKVSAYDLANMKDGDSVKTVNVSLMGLSETSKSRFNNNAITWVVGSGKNALILKPGKITAYETKKGVVAYLTVTDDASVKVLAGNTKGSIKLTATVDKKSLKTSIKVK